VEFEARSVGQAAWMLCQYHRVFIDMFSQCSALFNFSLRHLDCAVTLMKIQLRRRLGSIVPAAVAPIVVPLPLARGEELQQ
jgi:hypothetical protein